MQQHFVNELIRWNRKSNNRKMPWKGEKDPYKIWLSEIILQQTRVEQGLDYYNRFVETFPTIIDLAKASEAKVYKLWEGLGYYSRCKNLIHTAKFVAENYKGEFPSTYDEIIALKGIGSYTASAISSFAYNLPYAVVDGNVFRVLSRYFGIDTPIDSTAAKKEFTILAQNLLDKKKPGEYNQALMDFGAVICKPQQPLCSSCVMKKQCVAFNTNRVQELPIKEKKLIKKNRWLYYYLIEFKDKIYVRKRGENDIWENLYEFVCVESANDLSGQDVVDTETLNPLLGKTKYQVVSISEMYKQQLTHQTLYGRFIYLKISKELPSSSPYELVSKTDILRLPFPKFITSYLKDKNVSLNLFETR